MKTILYTFLTWLVCALASASEPITIAEKLELHDAIDQVLRKNLGLKIQRFRPEISADYLIIKEAAYDWNFSTSFNRSKGLSPTSGTALDGALKPESVTRRFSASADKKIGTGGNLSFSTGVRRSWTNSSFSTLNPNYYSNATLSFTQPLLRGSGMTVNLAPIVIAKTAHRQEQFRLRQNILNLIANTEVAYWQLAANQQLISLEASSLDVAKQLLEENRERLKLGMLTEEAVLQAEASLATRTESALIAQQRADNATDRLLNFLGVTPKSEDAIPQIAVDALPAKNPELPPLMDVINSSYVNDYELRILHDDIANRRLDLLVSKNQLFPSLDVSFNISALGRNKSFGSTYDDTYHQDGHEVGTGLTLSFPWDFRAEKAQKRQASKNLRIAEIQLAQTQQDLLYSARRSWRTLETNLKRREVADIAVEMNALAFEREKLRYDQGLASFRDLLGAQRDLDTSRTNHLRTWLDLIISQIRLKRIDGTLLDRHGFVWEEIEKKF